jgi:teichuronic acid biosynthesis glycosyltransferase TuaC
MKILFICSGNKIKGINSIVQNQGESLRKSGIEVAYFAIKGNGIINYAKNIFILRRYIKQERFDLFHAHYSFSAFTASLAGCKPLVVSLMGSDVHASILFRWLIRLFAGIFWQAVIVKSTAMAQRLKHVCTHIIPNGVNLETFKPADRVEAMSKTGFEKGMNIIFVANPERPEKNFRLAKAAVERLNNPNIRLHAIFDKPNQEMNWFYNAADMLLLTSLWEGSPNVVKEAMACNLPIISTAVGDVEEIISHTEGCLISSFDEKDLAAKIQIVLSREERTTGRNKLIELGLDSENIAKKIMQIYETLLL